MSKIKILTDSPADIPAELLSCYDITLMPISIYFGDTEYKDYVDIKPAEFYEKLKNSEEIPTTSQIRVVEFEEYFKKEIEAGNKNLICFTIAQEASGTFNNANLAKNMVAEEYPEADITVVSGSLSYLYGRMVVEAAKMAQDGKGKEEILTAVGKIRENTESLFVVDTLKYLKKGGRISPAVAGIGDVLNIKPILTVKDGLVTTVEKVRGSKRIIPKLIENSKAMGIEKAKEVYIFDGDADKDTIEAVKVALKENFGIENAAISVVGPVIGVNTGPGVFGVVFFK